MTTSPEAATEAIVELQRRSRRTLAIVVVGMLLVVASLVALVLRLNESRRQARSERDQAHTELARYKALRNAVEVAQTTADPREREKILAQTSRVADQSTVKPPQVSLDRIEVRMWICDRSPTANRTQAIELQKKRPGHATGRWRRDYLSVEDNARSNYRVTRNEIRYNPDEEDAADELLRMIGQTPGVDAAKVLTFFPTPNSISVFFCDGAKLAPPLPPQSLPRD